MNHINTASSCRCGHHKIAPVLVILFGLLFLLEYFGTITASFTAMAWPILVIILGLVKLKSGSCKCYAQASS
ncbi:MAG: DUF5668 domain-containing protein [Candidatus Paceibacterota bacterium]